MTELSSSKLSLATIAALVCLLLSCGAGERGATGASEPDDDSPATTAAAAASGVLDAGAEAAEALMREAQGGARNAFEMKVTVEGLDLPAIEGSSVMASVIGGANTQYSFIVRGGVGSVLLALRGAVKDVPGTYDPYNLAILFVEQKLSCGYSSVGGKSDGELAVTIAERDGGVRGEIAGDLVCRSMEGGASGGPWKARVEGWFER